MDRGRLEGGKGDGMLVGRGTQRVVARGRGCGEMGGGGSMKKEEG